MTRKERMLAAIRREDIDQIPFATYNLHGCGANEHGRDASYRQERGRRFSRAGNGLIDVGSGQPRIRAEEASDVASLRPEAQRA